MNVMATGSESITLKEEVFDDFLNAASNLLANDWTGVNESITNDMSLQYLDGVENLVKNIQVNNTLNISKPNLDLKVSKGDCNISVLNVTVKLNETGVQFKTFHHPQFLPGPFRDVNRGFCRAKGTSRAVKANG
ncbi:unnamed protein product [Pleuronectes platessa]|uniref:Uncharacterized protein n=1 Tax=Pleuronectes platessa TaxID=8262 RepID=A0A9N7V6Z4_PLEPL|nr:unnamed protein product [Pleuronectes platessa]